MARRSSRLAVVSQEMEPSDPEAIAEMHGLIYDDDGPGDLEPAARLTFDEDGQPTAADESDEEESGDNEVTEPPPKRPRRKFSIAHDDLVGKKLILLHVDLETAGEAVGVVQLSGSPMEQVSEEGWQSTVSNGPGT